MIVLSSLPVRKTTLAGPSTVKLFTATESCPNIVQDHQGNVAYTTKGRKYESVKAGDSSERTAA